MNQLTRGERKALAYHAAVADALRARPELLSVARTRLQWYRERNPSGKSYYDRWEALLAGHWKRYWHCSSTLPPMPARCGKRTLSWI